MYKFEFDANKSATNFEKHGINFVKAQEIWADPNFLQVKAISEGESRFLIIGTIAEKYWSAIITFRNENIRIISVRRSRKTEISLYEN